MTLWPERKLRHFVPFDMNFNIPVIKSTIMVCDQVAQPSLMIVVTPRNFNVLGSKRSESLSDFSDIEPSNFLCESHFQIFPKLSLLISYVLCMLYVIKIKIEASIRPNCVSSSDPRPSSQPPEREKQKISFQTGIMSWIFSLSRSVLRHSIKSGTLVSKLWRPTANYVKIRSFRLHVIFLTKVSNQQTAKKA